MGDGAAGYWEDLNSVASQDFGVFAHSIAGQRVRSCAQATKIDGDTLRTYFHHFTSDRITVYRDLFCNRRPRNDELNDISQECTEEGFRGCTGCIDYYKVTWKNCPVSWKGMNHNRKEGKLATNVPEAWCDRDL